MTNSRHLDPDEELMARVCDNQDAVRRVTIKPEAPDDETAADATSITDDILRQLAEEHAQ